MTTVLIRRGEEMQKRETLGECHMTGKAEIGVVLLLAKEHQRLPATLEAKREARNRFSPRAFRESVALLTP